MAFRKKRRKKWQKPARPLLYYAQILAWADEHHRRTGRWPTSESGWIPGTRGEKWHNVNQNLWRGERGLLPGSSLAQLLAEQRGYRNPKALPALTVELILGWADSHHRRTGQWPQRNSGPIVASPGETWLAANVALHSGLRGLPGGSSLARVLQEHRGVRNHGNLPALTAAQILTWADAHYRRMGRWPTTYAGPVADDPNETWSGVITALRVGLRGLPAGGSLAKLLAERRAVRNNKALPALTNQKILAWADAHHQRTGAWPRKTCGPIREAPGETWLGVDAVLRRGSRGLRHGSSLARLLAEQRGVRNGAAVPALTVQQILKWADAHHQRTGAWPRGESGPIQEARGETWTAVNLALIRGSRGLLPGSSLARLLARYRNVRHQRESPLTVPLILQWANAHHRRTERWPQAHAGPITDAPGLTWNAVDQSLGRGLHGLPPGGSLSRLLAAHGRR